MRALVGSRHDLALENMALRQQVGVLKAKRPRPPFFAAPLPPPTEVGAYGSLRLPTGETVGGVASRCCGLQYGVTDAEGGIMPTYEFACKKCGKKFTVMMSIGERESKRVRCPKCNSLRIASRVSTFYAVTSKKS